MPDMLEELYPYFKGTNAHLNLMNIRMGNTEMPKFQPAQIDNLLLMERQLDARGGYGQQDRMIKDKRKTLDKATLYSYQSAWVRRQIYDFEPVMEGVREADPVRALINPNKVKADYDEKILSVGFEHGFRVGDVFEWCNTKTYWLIYLQDMTELAYFRGDIRRCSYEIAWKDENDVYQRTYVSLRGPVETKIEYIQKNSISIDRPNYSLNILMPKTTANLKKFKRYSRFYLQGLVEGEDNTCWRVEAVNTMSTPGIIEINAVEYYANEHEDDLENGIADGLIMKPIDPNEGDELSGNIIGETFIKPKKEYIYYIDSSLYGNWYISNKKFPVKMETFSDDQGRNAVKIKWNSTYSGQFDLWFGDADGPLLDYKKTIVVESLF